MSIAMLRFQVGGCDSDTQGSASLHRGVTHITPRSGVSITPIVSGIKTTDSIIEQLSVLMSDVSPFQGCWKSGNFIPRSLPVAPAWAMKRFKPDIISKNYCNISSNGFLSVPCDLCGSSP